MSFSICLINLLDKNKGYYFVILEKIFSIFEESKCSVFKIFKQIFKINIHSLKKETKFFSPLT